MLTPYPQIVEYNEAVQHPQTAFRDPELQQGRVKLNALGLPVAFSGGFALTYPMTTPRRKLALRCFHRDITAGEYKYATIARVINALNSSYFVGFDYLADGIRIRGGFYPVLKMDWADGDPLGIWLDNTAGERRKVGRLREAFAALADYLERQGIAHGDIQNGNVIISRSGLKLVDYDGMFVPGMGAEFGCESGHKHFRHPRRTAADFGPTIDRFAFIAVDLSLAALTLDPSLYRRFCQGGETILFRASDFAAPERSEVFGLLAQHAALRPSVENFAAICRADVGAVPSLDDFRAGRNIPRQAAPPPATVSRAAETAPVPAERNRHLIAQLVGNGEAARPVAAVPRHAAASAPPEQPRFGRSNRAIVQALRPGAALRPSSPPAPAAPRPNFVPPRMTAAALPPRPRIAVSRRSPMPKTGSFIIHPRTAVPQAPASPPARAAAPLPTVWHQVLRFLGIG